MFIVFYLPICLSLDLPLEFPDYEVFRYSSACSCTFNEKGCGHCWKLQATGHLLLQATIPMRSFGS